MRAWRERAALCLAIDDLADRALDADLVLNQNLYAAELRYDAIASCPVLRGPDYALVDPAFHAVACRRDAQGRRVLVSFGGSDDGTLALGAARVLRRAKFAGPIDAVVSPLQWVLPELVEMASRPDAKIALHHGGDMPALMADAFLYVGGAGTTIFEAAVAGVAMLPIGIAENQRRSVESLRRHGIDAIMGFDTDRLAVAFRNILDDPARALLRGVVAPNGAKRVIRSIFTHLAPRIASTFCRV
jgi:spore coat polysaccharide biosynthesis predicted glycosyltransferase SpsG